MPNIHTYAVLPSLTATGDLAVTNPDIVPQGVLLPEPLVQAAIQTGPARVIAGHPLMIFDIPQVVHLTYPGYTAFEGIMRNNYGATRTDFRLVRGVQNEVIFFVRDIDRKPVSLSIHDALTIVIKDNDNDRLLLERTLSVVDLNKGMYKLTTLPAEMDTWPTGSVKWSMTYTQNSGLPEMLWTDQNYGVYSAAYVIESPYPGPAETTTLLWDDFTFNNDDNHFYSAALPAAAQDGYANGMQTFVVDMTNFDGTIEIDASTIAEPNPDDWFEVASNTYDGDLSQDIINVQGNFIWLRIVVAVTSGSIDSVQYKD